VMLDGVAVGLSRADCVLLAPLLVRMVRAEEYANGRLNPRLRRFVAEVTAVARAHRAQAAGVSPMGDSHHAPGAVSACGHGDAQVRASGGPASTGVCGPAPIVPSVVSSVTTGPASARLGVSERQVRRLCVLGRLPAHKEHGTWVIAIADLAGFLEGWSGS